MVRFIPVVGLLAATLCAQDKFTVRAQLTSSLNTKTNKPGDKITAEVLSPDEHKGAFLNGQVKEVKSGGKLKGTSVLSFAFDTLVKDGQETPVQAKIESVVNSKGKENVDEEGRIVKTRNNLPAVAVAAGESAIGGGILRGRKGAAIAAGAGAAAALIVVQFAVDGAEASFDSGSQFELSVETRK